MKGWNLRHDLDFKKGETWAKTKELLPRYILTRLHLDYAQKEGDVAFLLTCCIHSSESLLCPQPAQEIESGNLTIFQVSIFWKGIRAKNSDFGPWSLSGCGEYPPPNPWELYFSEGTAFCALTNPFSAPMFPAVLRALRLFRGTWSKTLSLPILTLKIALTKKRGKKDDFLRVKECIAALASKVVFQRVPKYGYQEW